MKYILIALVLGAFITVFGAAAQTAFASDDVINLDADKMETHPDLGHIVTLTNEDIIDVVVNNK